MTVRAEAACPEVPRSRVPATVGRAAGAALIAMLALAGCSTGDEGAAVAAPASVARAGGKAETPHAPGYVPTEATTVLTGEVQAVDAQILYTPPSNSSPVVLRYFVPEGERVEAGQVVLRIDPGNAAAQVRELDAQIEQAQARSAKELAELQVKAVDAELALVDAQAALEIARIDAGIPAALIARLDYDRHQGELDRAGREVALKQAELDAAREAVTRRAADGRLEIEKLRVDRAYNAAQMQSAEVRAEKAGVVLHGFNNNWIGGRIDEGSSTMPGSKAGEIVSGGRMRVRAWALAPDRRALQAGGDVRVLFDALPGQQARGRIASIAGAPEPRPEWGEGRYFVVDIDLLSQQGLALMPGMSARVLATSGPGDSAPGTSTPTTSTAGAAAGAAP